eukprot:GHVS01007618.1.p1 GENE.GHVS01007618.1~~GHVS01007618.1.p1  ORF type:complete len:807 (-),score=161.21 GHVS01007618.1:311-2731(-)
MAVLGVDIGSQNCVLASVGRGAVSVVRNEISERLTPALVGFTDTERLIGEDALTQIKSNFKNTCRGMKTLLGRSARGSEMTYERLYCLCQLTGEDNTGEELGYAVSYKGEPVVISATRVLAALLTRLRETAEKNKGVAVTDVVIGAPGWYTDVNRSALLAAARMAGLNCRRIINEYTATALDYGIYRSADFDEKIPTRVAFFSMGHHNTSVAIVDFVRSSLKVVHEAGDRMLGGRDMDLIMVKKYGELFKQQSKLDALESPKARIKLEEVCRKAKTILSANSEAGINVECLVGESDISATITRQEFELMCEPIAERLRGLIERCISESAVDIDTIEHVEIAGGCTRIPWVQQTVSKYFKKEVSKTLCMDECVARGCALQAAMCSALYKVREFGVWDKNNHAIEIFTEGGDLCQISDGGTAHGEDLTAMGGEGQLETNSCNESSCVLFAKGCFTNTSKYITFNKKQSFDIIARYQNVSTLPEGTAAVIGRYTVVVPSGGCVGPSGYHVIKVKAKLDYNGIFVIEKALIVEDVEVEETIMERVPVTPKAASAAATDDGSDVAVEAAAASTTDEGQTAEVASESKEADVPMAPLEPPVVAPVEPEFKEVAVKRMVKKQKRTEIAVNPTHADGRLSETQIHQFFEDELSMSNDDRVQQETKERMNELEGYIYDMKHKCSDTSLPYTFPTSKEDFCKQLDEAENWLYDNYEALKTAFVNKLAELKANEPQLPPPPPPPPAPSPEVVEESKASADDEMTNASSPTTADLPPPTEASTTTATGEEQQCGTAAAASETTDKASTKQQHHNIPVE